ncbi:MAG: toxic anion resistance protein [Clostridia bacterium]|nr:toxic anion resistance protein [Clostridia bacterium]
MAADREATGLALANSPEMEALTAQIDVNDLETIVTFGARAAEEISKASDLVLRSMSAAPLDDTNRMMNALARVMGQFDMNEVRDNPSLWGRLFGKGRVQMDKILDKYHTLGDDVDRIYVQLRQYETDIRKSNQQLEAMFQSNVQYYHELVKYILAGEQGCREIADYIGELQQTLERTGNQELKFEIQSLQQAHSMLEQRTQDLRTAEIVAMQSIPMLKTMQFNNMNLVRKINSAFIITLPVFKQALAQAILLKRQRLQSQALAALDARTNEMLIKNARNTVEQAKINARLASGTPIQPDTLEQAWHTILNGIDETRRIQQDAVRQQAQDQQKLEQIKREYREKLGAGRETE